MVSIRLRIFKWFQVTNNNHLLQRIKSSGNYFLIQCIVISYQVFLSNPKNFQRDIFDSYMIPQEILPLCIRVDLG